MINLQLALFDTPGGRLLFDPSYRVRGLRFSTNEWGFGELTGFVPMPRAQASWLRDLPGRPHVLASGAGAVAWEGRLLSVRLVNGGVNLRARGYWSALRDLPYTGMWSVTSLRDFRPVTSNDVASRQPQKYVQDNLNRVFTGLKKNQTYANNNEAGDWTVAAPHGGEKNIAQIVFTYNMLLPAGWNFAVQSFNYDFTGFTSEFSLAATGILQSATVTQSLVSPKDRVCFRIINATGAPYTWAGEDGANYLNLTGIRIKGTTSASVYADEIARALVASVSATNPTQLSAVTGMIESPGLDLRDEVYTDTTALAILARLKALGDSQTPPREWVARVWEERRLQFCPVGAHNETFYADLLEPDVETNIDTLYNSAYGLYSEPSGAAQRTASASDGFSVKRYGVTRRTAVSASTTSSAQAAVHRDAYISDHKTPAPRSRLRVERLYTVAGALVPLWRLRAGSRLILRNVPPTLGTDIDRWRSFIVAETDYDADANLMYPVPENPLSTLDVMVARRSAGV